MLVAELDDVGGGYRTDSVDRFELFDGGAAEAYRPVFGAGARAAAATPPGPSSGTRTCWPSLSRAARLIASSAARGRRRRRARPRR